MHPITYIFLLGKREEIWNPLVPFSELTNRYLLSLGEYPQCLNELAGPSVWKNVKRWWDCKRYGIKVVILQK